VTAQNPSRLFSCAVSFLVPHLRLSVIIIDNLETDFVAHLVRLFSLPSWCVPFERKIRSPIQPPPPPPKLNQSENKNCGPSRADQATKVEKSQVAPAVPAAPMAAVQHHRVGTQPADPMRPGKCVCLSLSLCVCVPLLVWCVINLFFGSVCLCGFVNSYVLAQRPTHFSFARVRGNSSRVFAKRMYCTTAHQLPPDTQQQQQQQQLVPARSEDG
jgi:hypothetical protein